MRISLLSATTIAALLLICSASTVRTNETYFFDYENVLGTSFELKVVAPSEIEASKAEAIALQEIDRLAGILSSYDSSSEFSRWQKTFDTDIKVSPELFEVLSLFDQWRERTNGALNASAGVGIALWKDAVTHQKLPDSHELAMAATAMNKQHWSLDADKHTAKHLSTDPLMFNSFVKSYIIRKALDQVMNTGDIKSAVINIGGDIAIAGEQTERVTIANPKADAENDQPISVLKIGNKAIATSGNYRRGYQIGEEWFSHIMDARTAMPVSKVISATVVADNATDAGALATAFNILSPTERDMLVGQFPDVEYLIVNEDGTRIESTGWNNLEIASSSKTETKPASEFELTIDLELARFEGRSHRPFVAVWIENKKKESVRNLALWFNKPRWLPDLKKWYGKNYEANRTQERMGLISSATRSAGKYTLKWDGLDDEGKAVKSGKYTIYIEAAREHGTYQLIKQEIEWNSKAQHFDLQGGVEITSAALDYHLVAQP